MRRTLVLLVLTGCLSCLFGQQTEKGINVSRAMPKPDLPYYDWHACPGEDCMYGKRTARKAVTVLTHTSKSAATDTKWPDGAGYGGDNCGATYLDEGKKAWWAEVKIPSGKLGWIDMDNSDLDGACALAATQRNDMRKI